MRRFQHSAGDLAVPRIAERMRTARHVAPVPVRQGTFFGLVAIDHIFVSPEFDVHSVRVHASLRARLASDHLPFLADLGLPSRRKI